MYLRPSPRARGASLGWRHELHASARRRQGAARAPRSNPRAADGGLGNVIRELAENPNVHQPHSGGRRLVHDPDGRYIVYLGSGTGPHSANVKRVRLEPGEVASAVEEIRTILRDNGRGGSEWELGESSTPADPASRPAATCVQLHA